MIRKLFLIILALPLLFAASVMADTADEIINKNLQARGGIEKLKAVKSMTMTGKMMFQGVEAPFVVKKRRPNHMRIEFTLQGLTGIQGYDGQTPWEVMPFTGNKDPQKMTEQEARLFIEQADFDGPLVDYKEKGNAIELVGTEDVEGTEAHKLKVTLKNGDVRYFYIDAENNLEMKLTSIIKREGSEVSVDSYFGDYKEVNGLMIPHVVENRAKDQPQQQFVLEKVELDRDMDDALFVMPAAAPQTQPVSK